VLEGNAIFRNIYCWLSGSPGNAEHCTPAGFNGVKDGLLPPGWEWVAYVVAGFTIMFILINGFMLGSAVFIYMERRLLGRFQSRLGPNRVGPWGLLQPIADILKLLTKEDIIPKDADKVVFTLAPIVMLAPALLILAVVPFGANSFLANLNVGILYVLAIGGMTTIAIFMAGWASANKYALFGSMRAVAQLISYEIPAVLSIVGILLLVGSLSMVKIVEAQTIPFLLVQPLGLFIFLVGTSAELNRTPFDLVEAESEIIAGYHTEYSGIKFALFQAAEFGSILVAGGVISVLFLKGWEGPFLPSHVWFIIKVMFIAFLMIWIRATLPRLRVDQIMEFAWKFLFPLSLLNIFVTATEVFLLGEEAEAVGKTAPVFSTGDWWLMAGINFVVLVVGIVAFSWLIAKRRPTVRQEAAWPVPGATQATGEAD